jgi:hypothetical protein
MQEELEMLEKQHENEVRMHTVSLEEAPKTQQKPRLEEPKKKRQVSSANTKSRSCHVEVKTPTPPTKTCSSREITETTKPRSSRFPSHPHQPSPQQSCSPTPKRVVKSHAIKPSSKSSTRATTSSNTSSRVSKASPHSETKAPVTTDKLDSKSNINNAKASPRSSRSLEEACSHFPPPRHPSSSPVSAKMSVALPLATSRASSSTVPTTPRCSRSPSTRNQVLPSSQANLNNAHHVHCHANLPPPPKRREDPLVKTEPMSNTASLPPLHVPEQCTDIVNSTTTSSQSQSQSKPKRDHGWSVPIGVHKVTCSSPGLTVTCDVHRRSAAVKRINSGNGSSKHFNRRGSSCKASQLQDLILPPGKYVEVLETQVHGGRVRGRIVYEEEVETSGYVEYDSEKTKGGKRRSSFLIGKLVKNKDKSEQCTSSAELKVIMHKYTGWVSLRRINEDAGCKEGGSGPNSVSSSKKSKCFILPTPTDEDSGPWTSPVALGVYRVSFSHGLPIRKSSERDSPVVGLLERGQYVEVVETQVKGDRVRARCLVSSDGGDSMSSANGWISLFNAVTGSSGASAVPLGAYVAVAESGCTVTDGGSITSKVRETLARGSCVKIVATRIEDGEVRGLIATGGHVTLISSEKASATKGIQRIQEADQATHHLMPVPCGIYQIIYPNGLAVSAGVEEDTPVTIKLDVETRIQVVETSVENGRVRGRIVSYVVKNDKRKKLENGWIDLFESSRRWCKFAFA